MKMKTKILPLLLSAVAAAAGADAQSVCPGQFAGRFAVENRAGMMAEAFDLQDVRLLPSRFRENMERDSAWIMSLDCGRLLHSFRNNAGVFSGREGGYMTIRKYGGWESLDCDLRGHTTGHVLSACALMYAATGEEVFRMKGDSLVAGLAEVQRALGGSGYLAAFPETLVDRNIRGESVWAPFYTLHKLCAGLIDQYLYCGSEEALAVVRAMGDWACGKLLPLDDALRRRMIRNEFGGMGEAMWNLYALTGEVRYERVAEFFYHNDMIDPLRECRGDLGTKHANTFLPKVLAEARNYELTTDSASRRSAEFFWRTVTSRHCFATGELSDKEHFFDTEHACDHLSGYTGENCCTYNMLKLGRHIFCWTVDAAVADYYERALYNHILGQQDPESGMVCYFTPLMNGAYKVYSTPENSFWCCVGSGFESHAKYGEGIYYRDADGVWVNLFIPSRLVWRERGIVLEQRTAFPEEETTRLHIAECGGSRFTLRLRYPSWSGRAVLRINGRRTEYRVEDGYVCIARRWRAGDTVEFTCPMSLRTEGVSGDASRAALLYGPVVLACDCGPVDAPAPAPFSDPVKYNDYYTYDYRVPAGLDFSLDPTRVEHLGGLQFRTADGRTIRPLYDMHRRRYAVYWTLSEQPGAGSGSTE